MTLSTKSIKHLLYSFMPNLYKADPNPPGEHSGPSPPGEHAGPSLRGEHAGTSPPGEHVGSTPPGEHAGSTPPGEHAGSTPPGEHSGPSLPGEHASPSPPGKHSGPSHLMTTAQWTGQHHTGMRQTQVCKTENNSKTSYNLLPIETLVYNIYTTNIKASYHVQLPNDNLNSKI